MKVQNFYLKDFMYLFVNSLENICSIRWMKWNQKLKQKNKSKIFFVGVNENLTTFLFFYTLWVGGTREHFLEGEKISGPPF